MVWEDGLEGVSATKQAGSLESKTTGSPLGLPDYLRQSRTDMVEGLETGYIAERSRG